MVADIVIGMDPEMDPEMDLEMEDMEADHAKTIHERDPTTTMDMRKILENYEGIRYNRTSCLHSAVLWWVFSNLLFPPFLTRGKRFSIIVFPQGSVFFA